MFACGLAGFVEGAGIGLLCALDVVAFIGGFEKLLVCCVVELLFGVGTAVATGVSEDFSGELGLLGCVTTGLGCVAGCDPWLNRHADPFAHPVGDKKKVQGIEERSFFGAIFIAPWM